MYIYTNIYIYTHADSSLYHWTARQGGWIFYHITNYTAAHSAVLSPAIQNTPYTMNITNILSQCTMYVRLALFQKFKIKANIFCWFQSKQNRDEMHHKIFPLWSSEILLTHGYKPLVWYIKTQACRCVNCDINLRECITDVTLCFLEDAFLRHEFADKGFINTWRIDMKCCVNMTDWHEMSCKVMVYYRIQYHSLYVVYNEYITNCNGVNVRMNSWT